jgi:hypothetical protein
MPVSCFGLYRGDCTATADSPFGRRDNNPYSHYRILKVSERGTRERTLMLGCVIALRYQVGLGSKGEVAAGLCQFRSAHENDITHRARTSEKGP